MSKFIIQGLPEVVTVEQGRICGSWARNLISFCAGSQSTLGLVAFVGVILFGAAALLSYTVQAKGIFTGEDGPWRPASAEGSARDGALFVHKKVMQVTSTGSGIPVLRLVECRHYAKEHNKLIQTGVTSAGLPILKFVPGDYCILAGAEVGAPDPSTVQIHTASLADLHVPVSVASALSLPRDLAHFFGRSMTYYQQYTCEKFGTDCRVALAIQAAENGKGDCQAYHYNSDGSLDWGYFQINSVHLTRRGVNLRDLLDCKANIDFAYRLFKEEGFQPWSTYVSGEYRKFLRDSVPGSMRESQPRRPEEFLRADLF